MPQPTGPMAVQVNEIKIESKLNSVGGLFLIIKSCSILTKMEQSKKLH
jgi:hypothetical protein